MNYKSKFEIFDKFDIYTESIHPILNQNIQETKKIIPSVDELIENAVNNGSKGDTYLKSILSGEEVFFKKIYFLTFQ